MTKVVFMGTPDVTLPILDKLNADPDNEILRVYTAPDRQSGRGKTISMSPVKVFAEQHGLMVSQPVSLRDINIQNELAALQPDIIVVAAYGKFLPTSILKIPRHGCLNIHPSLLPLHRGPSPVISSILSDDKVTGTTLMLLDEGMDSGPIIKQSEVVIHPMDTAESLTASLFILGADLLSAYINPWMSGEITAHTQNEAFATITRKIGKADGEISWSTEARNLERQCRAFTPWPSLYTHWNNKLLKLLEVEVELDVPEINYEPGRVINLLNSDVPVGIVTGDGILGVKQLQIEGKPRTSIHQFLSGYPDFVGSLL
jgi:methionyl-tRNA formyltransferase